MGVWLTGIVILLIVGILLDGWRRMRQGRQNNLKMPSYQSQFSQADDDYPSELPNGGARVVAHRRTEPKIGPDPDWVGDDGEWDDEEWDDAHGDGNSFYGKSTIDQGEPSAQSSETQPAQMRSSAPEDQQPQADESRTEPSAEISAETDPEPASSLQDEPADEPRIPQQVTLNLDESVPMLMESVEQDEPEPLRREPKAEPARETVAEPKAPATPARPTASDAASAPNSAEEAPE